MEAIKEGVGALIIQEDSFLTIEELHLSRKTHKVPGMRSMIFETIEAGETHNDTLLRALTEEVKLINFLQTDKADDTPLCKVQINQGVWLHAYLLPIKLPKDFLLEIGTTFEEVRSPGWDSMHVVLMAKSGDLRFRPGNREVIRSYFNSLPNLKNQYVYQETEDIIADEVYKLFEPRNELGSLQPVPALF